MASQEDQAGSPGAGQENSATATSGAKKSSSKAKRILTTLGVLVLLGAAYEGWHWYSYSRFHEETDDAYLEADNVTLLARDTGYISQVMVAPNAPVKKDQVIARIDPVDYELALESARNDLNASNSSVKELQSQLIAGKAAVTEAEAALEAAKATYDGAEKAYKRALALMKSTAGNQSTLDSTEAEARSTKANVKSAEAALEQAKAQISVLEAELDSARIDVQAKETAVKQAQRDLDFTYIRAPATGILTERQIETGSYVAAGSTIGTLVPVGRVYAEANFKETQVAGVRPGATVTLSVDAWPDVTLHGTVESMTAGTGSVFSLLPSSNATGNFTKVVQRVPVRIAIDPTDRASLPLLPGMSVIVTVDTRTGHDTPLMPIGFGDDDHSAPDSTPDMKGAVSGLGTESSKG